MTGGQVLCSNITSIGDGEPGQMAVSNGTWQAEHVFVGGSNDPGLGGTGTLTVDGGTNTFTSTLNISYGSGCTGTVWLTGGQLSASEVDVGGAGLGRMTIEGGSSMAQTVCVGCTSGPVAELTMTGGSLTILGNVVIGDCTADGIAFVQIGGGSTVYVTNAAHNAVLDVRNGFLLLKGGTLVVDKFVATNGCDSIFDHIGGTLIVGTLVLDPNQDADGDGLPNGWEQAHGLDPLSSIGNNGADGDPDGDGYSNYQEYLAGSDPQNPFSTPVQIIPPPFQITSIARQGNNVVLTWTTPGGTTNQVQVTGGTGNGSYATNGFTNLGGQMVIGGSGSVITNYLDVGGATNKPSRYYCVRLVP
jgi:Bacterial TSP3 repeat